MIGAEAIEVQVEGTGRVVDRVLLALAVIRAVEAPSEQGAVEDFEQEVQPENATVLFMIGLVEGFVVELGLLRKVWLLLL